MIRRLLQLNGLAILGVILFHAAGWGFVAMFAWQARYAASVTPDFDPTGSAAYFALRLMEQLAVFAIPAFLFVSGYFVAFATRRDQRTVGWNVIGARIKGLAIPYLIWSVALFTLAALQGQVFTPTQYLIGLLTGQANPAYYYVPLLIQFYLLAPLLVPLARRRWRLLLLATALIQLTVQVLYFPTLYNVAAPAALEPFVDVLPKWLFPVRIFWFTLGMVAGFHLAELKALLARIKWPALIAAILLIPLGVIEWETILRLSQPAAVGPSRDIAGHGLLAGRAAGLPGLRQDAAAEGPPVGEPGRQVLRHLPGAFAGHGVRCTRVVSSGAVGAGPAVPVPAADHRRRPGRCRCC
ncbi:MAG: acyltransferase [Anaerolineae bacterium]